MIAFRTHANVGCGGHPPARRAGSQEPAADAGAPAPARPNRRARPEPPPIGGHAPHVGPGHPAPARGSATNHGRRVPVERRPHRPPSTIGRVVRVARAASTGGALLALMAPACAPGVEEGPRGSSAAAEVVVVWGGGLFDGTGDAVVPNPGIVIAEGRFRAVDAVAASEAVAAGAEVVEVGEGEVILPGLLDLHAHFHLDLLGEGRVDETTVYPALFLANGVTSTFPNGEASPDRMRALRERLRSGEQVGARLLRSGPYFGSARVGWDPDFTAADIHRQVDALVAEGVAGFKAKTIAPVHLRALIERAHHHGLTVTGHLGSGFRGSVNPRDAIHMGIDRIEHFMGGDAMPADRPAYDSFEEMTPDTPEFERIVQLFLDEGVHYDATLSAYGYSGARDPDIFEPFADEMSYLTPYARGLVEARLAEAPRRVSEQFERIYQVKQRLIKRFHDMGGGHLITMGTDHPSTGEFLSPFSVHRELALFVKSGIPEAAALRFATLNAARALRVDHDLGTVQAGGIADLVILEGNPLDDIRNTRNPRMVFKDGVAHDPAELLASSKGRIGPRGPEDLAAFAAVEVPPPGGS